MKFTKEDLELQNGLKKEWLITNGIDDLIEKDTPKEAPEPQEGENADKNQEEKEIKKEEQ